MIDFDLEIKDVKPINLKEMELSWYKVDDNTIESIILYNKAISEIKAKCLDVAIKDLKKALSSNKGFTEAERLLGLCYASNEEYKKAEKTFKRLAKYGIFSDLAKEYSESLAIERIMPKVKDAARTDRISSNNEKNKSILTKKLVRDIIIVFLIFVVVTAGFTITHSATSNLQTSLINGKSDSKTVNSQDKFAKDSEKNTALVKKDTISYEDFKNVEKELNNTKLQLGYYKNKYNIMLMLNDAEKFYKSGDYEEAANILIHMKNMKFDNDIKMKFDKLWLELKTNKLWIIYNKGNKLYKEGRYKEALPKLKLVSEINPKLGIMPWVYYQIGKCYEEANDNNNAIVYLNKIKDNYPKSKYAIYSQSRINQMKNKKGD